MSTSTPEPMPAIRCSVCREPGQDRRTVSINCGYDLTEAGLPELPRTNGFPRRYGVQVCKACRADLIGLLRGWVHGGSLTARDRPPADGSPAAERLYPVRIDGVAVMLTLSEYHDHLRRHRP